MQTWRRIGWAGIILGQSVIFIDRLAGGIPYELIMPAELASLVLIFTGFIRRKQGQE